MWNALVREVRLHLPAEVRDVVDVERVRLEARWILHRVSALLRAARLHDHGRWRHPRGHWHRGRPLALAARLEKGCHARWQIWPVPGSGAPGGEHEKGIARRRRTVRAHRRGRGILVGGRQGWLARPRTHCRCHHGQGNTGRCDRRARQRDHRGDAGGRIRPDPVRRPARPHDVFQRRISLGTADAGRRRRVPRRRCVRLRALLLRPRFLGDHRPRGVRNAVSLEGDQAGDAPVPGRVRRDGFARPRVVHRL